MITLIIGLGIYLIIYINSESYSCMSSPLTYGVSKFKTNLGQIICSCNIEEETCECPIPQTIKTIKVTKDNIFIDDNSLSEFIGINFTLQE